MSTNTATLPSISLSEVDQAHMETLEVQLDLLRDRTRSVADRYQVGAYIVGRPGTGKTFAVEERLTDLDVPWTYRNCRMSAVGLFETLAMHPEHTIVLDDINSLFKQAGAMQVLMGALGGKPGSPRRITYTIKGDHREAWFSGGIVAISNVPLRRDPLGDAVASRMAPYQFEPSDDEMVAFMHHLATKGFEDLGPEECWEVCEFVIEESRSLDHRLDLRTLVKGWQDYRMYKADKCYSRWQDLIRSTMKRLIPEAPEGRAARREWLRGIAEQLATEYPDDRRRRDHEWERLTGTTYHTLYRRLRGE